MRRGVALTALLLAACTAGDPTAAPPPVPSTSAPATTTTVPQTTTTVPLTTTSTEAPEAVGVLSEWVDDRATLTVPLDHDDPGGPTIEIPVSRRPAEDPTARVGVLFVNPGGPGVSAAGLVTNAELIYSDDLRAAFDIIALEPRGTFPDLDVDCGSGLADYLSGADWTPDTAAEVEALAAHVEANVDACAAAHPGLLEHISTTDTVHDLALLVGALGEDQVSWFGFSYGTTLGSVFATLYPDLVRAAVFDGAFYPYGYGDPLAQAIVDAEAQDALVVRLADECDDDPACPIDGPALAAFTRVAAVADETPFGDLADLAPVNQGAFAFSLLAGDHAYGAPAAPFFEAVAAADAGDGAPLQRFFDHVTEWQGAGGATLPIRCMDYPTRGTPQLRPEDLPAIEAAAPTLYTVFPTAEGFEEVVTPTECDLWPEGPDTFPLPMDATGVPVLVVTATGDPVTPAGSAARLAEDLADEVVLVVDDDQHVSYDRLGPPARRCAAAAIDAFLIDLVAPDSLRCEA